MAVMRTTTAAGDPAWLVSDYHTVRALLRNPSLGRSHPDPNRASRYSKSALFGRPERNFATEAADHARMRSLLGPWFSGRRLQNLRPRVSEFVNAVLNDLQSRPRPADLHDAVSFPLPALVICELLGVPYADRERLRRWSDAAADMTDEARSSYGLASLGHYMTDLVTSKLDHPGDDILSALVAAHRADPEEFGLDKVAQLAAGLLFAGHETTMTAIDTGVVLLTTRPAQRDALRRHPSLVADAVEEILRFSLPIPDYADGPGQGIPRWTRSPVEVDGVTIPAGDLVVLDLRRANHDPELVGDRPDFTIDRHPNAHLTFGHGPHFCLGAPLARMELQILFPKLLARFPGLRLAVDVAQLRPRSGLLTGGLAKLPVHW